MKTTWIASKKSGLIPVIVTALFFVFASCSEDYIGNPADEGVSYDNASIITEFFKVHPAGTTIHAFGGDVILDFPPGTVKTITRYSIVSFPLDHLDMQGKNVMMRAFTLKNVMNENEFEKPPRVVVRYDLCGFNMCKPGEESDLAIFKLLGDRHAFHKIEALGECILNESCKTVMACIDECGSYIVVER